MGDYGVRKVLIFMAAILRRPARLLKRNIGLAPHAILESVRRTKRRQRKRRERADGGMFQKVVAGQSDVSLDPYLPKTPNEAVFQFSIGSVFR